MIRLVEHADMLQHPYGDYDVYGGGCYMAESPSQEFLDACNPVSLSFWSYRPMRSMLQVGIDKSDLIQFFKAVKVSDDPFSGMDYYGVVPSILLTADLSKYDTSEIRTAHLGMAQDKKWNREYTFGGMFEPGDDFMQWPPTGGERGMMGSGHTDFTLPSDGSASMTNTFLTLDNGDFVMCHAWCWHNK